MLCVGEFDPVPYLLGQQLNISYYASPTGIIGSVWLEFLQMIDAPSNRHLKYGIMVSSKIHISTQIVWPQCSAVPYDAAYTTFGVLTIAFLNLLKELRDNAGGGVTTNGRVFVRTKAELNRLEALRRVMAEKSYRMLCKGS